MPPTTKGPPRIEQLARFGPVVITSYPEDDYHLLDYLRRYTPAPIRTVVWISIFLQIMEERVYPSLPGQEFRVVRSSRAFEILSGDFEDGQRFAVGVKFLQPRTSDARPERSPRQMGP
jgi:hypothetical protein